MLNIILLLLLFSLIYSERRLIRKRISVYDEIRQLEVEINNLESQKSKTTEDNSRLNERLSIVINIFELVKGISKYLNEDEFFMSFKARCSSFIRFLDCKYSKVYIDEAHLGYESFPLSIGRKTIGYLNIKGMEENQKNWFSILKGEFSLGLKRVKLYTAIEELAIKDHLTDAFTRQYSFERINEEIQRSARNSLQFALGMLDIDHFKDLNDKYGHLVGDVVLRAISDTIKKNIREIDLSGRYGGEEFLLLFPETNREGGKFACERIRTAVEQKIISAYDEKIKVSVSMGISTYPNDAKGTQELIDKADFALYRAKQTGRNKVCAFGKYE